MSEMFYNIRRESLRDLERREEMFDFFKKKTSGKPKAAVFVDYEHWYYGYHNKVQMKPNVEEWIDELKQ